MTYKIPDSLLPYLEYIPEDMLASIIDDALKEKIFSKPVETTQPVTSPAIDIPQLVEQLKSVIGTGSAPQIEKALKEETESSTSSFKPVMITTDTEEIDADLQDIVADFAGGLFK